MDSRRISFAWLRRVDRKCIHLSPSYKLEDFDSIIFECLERALSTIGQSDKEMVLFVLKNQYHISSKNVARDLPRLEEILKGLLGQSVSAFVIIHILDNISAMFKVSPQYGSTLEQTTEAVKRIYEKTLVLNPKLGRFPV